MNDKTILILALGVGAFLMTRKVGPQPTGNGATAAQKAFADGNQGPAVVPSIYKQAGGLLVALLGKVGTGTSGESLTSQEYTDTAKTIVSNPFGVNMFDTLGLGKSPFGAGLPTDSTSNPFSKYIGGGGDSLATNPAPGFSSVYDYSKEYWF